MVSVDEKLDAGIRFADLQPQTPTPSSHDLDDGHSFVCYWIVTLRPNRPTIPTTVIDF